jgi:hypothetical protein
MIPYLVTVCHRRADGRRRSLHVPVLPLLLVLSPLLLLAVPIGGVACLFYRVSPMGALAGIGRSLWALPGTRIELEDGPIALLVSVR